MHHRAYHLSCVSNSQFHGFSLWDRLAISRSRCNVLRQDREITRVYACIFRMQRRTLNLLENLRSYPRLDLEKVILNYRSKTKSCDRNQTDKL